MTKNTPSDKISPDDPPPDDMAALVLLELEFLSDALRDGRVIVHSRSKTVSRERIPVTALCIEYTQKT